MPLVRAVAARIRASIPPSVELDDLVQAGVLGLLDAMSKYDPKRPTKFKEYAKHRIRGAIVDSLRRLDPASRTLRHRQRKVEAATRELSGTLRREPTELEVAHTLGVEIEALQETKAKLASLQFISVSPGAAELNGHNVTFEVGAKPEDGPERSVTIWELNRVLTKMVCQLPARQQEVVRLYYNQDLTMKQIGTRFSVNESRISQTHSKALGNLRTMLRQVGVSSVGAF
jgi:RNA polymerase sigma factor FliA